MEIRRSETLGALAEALAKAQLEFPPIKKESVNPFYGRKYADLAALVDATRPALAKHGVVVIQTARVIQGRAVEVSTMLLHSSGEFLAQDLVLPAYQDVQEDAQRQRAAYQRFDAQTIGIAITYGRRYSYGAILNLAAEEDDDANGLAQTNGRTSAKPVNGNGNGNKPVAAVTPTITQTEQNAFWSAAKKSGKSREQVREYLATRGIEGTDQLLKTDFAQALEWALEAA